MLFFQDQVHVHFWFKFIRFSSCPPQVVQPWSSTFVLAMLSMTVLPMKSVLVFEPQVWTPPVSPIESGKDEQDSQSSSSDSDSDDKPPIHHRAKAKAKAKAKAGAPDSELKRPRAELRAKVQDNRKARIGPNGVPWTKSRGPTKQDLLVQNSVQKVEIEALKRELGEERATQQAAKENASSQEMTESPLFRAVVMMFEEVSEATQESVKDIIGCDPREVCDE